MLPWRVSLIAKVQTCVSVHAHTHSHTPSTPVTRNPAPKLTSRKPRARKDIPVPGGMPGGRLETAPITHKSRTQDPTIEILGCKSLWVSGTLSLGLSAFGTPRFISLHL